MPVGATISGAAALGSAAIGYFGSQNASDKQTEASKNALALQQQMYQQSRADLAPYRDIGNNATQSIASLYGFGGANGGKPDYSQFYNTPDYGFAFQQGQNATQNVLSAKGGLLSGGGLAALTNYGQGMASQQYGNYFNRLMGLTQVGATAAGQGANQANQFGVTGGNTMQGIGQAQASGAVGGANALSGGLGGVGQAGMLWGLSNRFPGSNAGSNPSAYSGYAGISPNGTSGPVDY